MGDFEKELRCSRLRLREEVDTEKFIENLENRIIQKNNRQRSFIATSILVLFFGLISIPNFNKVDNLDLEYPYYIRIMTKDITGVLSKITNRFS